MQLTQEWLHVVELWWRKKPVVRLSLSLTANASEGELRSRQVLRFHGPTSITPGRTTATAEPDQELTDECFEAGAKHAAVVLTTWTSFVHPYRWKSRNLEPCGLVRPGHLPHGKVAVAAEKSDAWMTAKWLLSCWCSAGACMTAASWRHRQCILKYGAVVPRTKTASVNRNRKSEYHQYSDEGSAHCPVSTSAVQQFTKETE